MKKIILILLLGLFLISFTSAIQTLGIFRQGDCIDLVQTCSNCTYNNISTIITESENPTVYLINNTMSREDTYYNYTFCNTTLLGEYIVNGFGDPDGEKTIWNYDLEITPGGFKSTSAQSILYIGLLAILVFVIFASFFAMNLLPTSNTKDEEGKILSINYLKYLRLPLWMFVYFLFIAIIFLSSNISRAFLQEQMFGNLLFSIFSILLALSPVVIILILISFFVRFFHDRKFQRLLNRGMFPQGGV